MDKSMDRQMKGQADRNSHRWLEGRTDWQASINDIKDLLTQIKQVYYWRMEQHVFYYFNDYRGHHRKGIAIDAGTEVNLHKKISFIQQKW